jgi:uncharacterized membrane protein YdjX (TVP38/TMEM64 family)
MAIARPMVTGVGTSARELPPLVSVGAAVREATESPSVTRRGGAAWKRVALLVVAVACIAALHATGMLDVWGEPERAKAMLLDMRGWGYLLYVGCFALLEPFGIPGAAFVLSAGLVWSTPVAFTLSLVGGVGAGIVGFSVARFLARDWISARLPQRFRRFDDRIAQRGLMTVILVRLVFFLAPPSHWVLGLSNVRFATFVFGTAIGVLPGMALLTLAGALGGEWLAGQQPIVWGLALVAVTAWLAARRFRRRREVDDARPR